MAFKKGKLVFNQAGALPPAALEELVQRVKEFDVDAAIAAQNNQPGQGIRVFRPHLRVDPAENGPVHEASAELVHGTNATKTRHLGWSAGSPVGHAEWQGRGIGEPPQLARRGRGLHGAGSVRRTRPGQRDSAVTATGPGNR
jgi:hypothetical protein